jgi:hypothetical protein
MMFYLSPWWVEVISYSPKSRIVRYRRLARGKAPLQHMSRLRFERMARAG